jgi:hypothetical protein
VNANRICRQKVNYYLQRREITELEEGRTDSHDPRAGLVNPEDVAGHWRGDD